MIKHVLLIDDDKLPMQYYVRALKGSGFEVVQCFEPDSALDFVKKNSSQIDLVILDIMLPPGHRYKGEDTNEGLTTGVFLLKDIRKYCLDVPVIILTNVRNPNTLDEFKEDSMLKLVQKTRCPPFELIGLVKEMVGEQ